MALSTALNYGMFVMPIHDPRKPLAQCFDEDLELAVKCEELGFSDFWVGEHHSSSYENIVMPEIFLGKVLGMTKSMRVGAAPVCLQYHHPAHVAGRLAFLDHLSHGRLNVCFGPGAVPTDMEVYGVDPKDTGARIAEAIDMILKIWTSDPPYELDGQFWKVRLRDTVDDEMGIGTLHKPLQRPTPPIFVPSISRASVGLKAAAARGFRPISHHMLHEEILVADTTAEAQKLARNNSLGSCVQYILDLTNRTSGSGLTIWKPDSKMSDDDCNLDYFMDQVIIAGDPEHVTRQILELRQRIGPFGTLVLVAHDWDDRDHWIHSLELFAHEVAPRLNRAAEIDAQTLL